MEVLQLQTNDDPSQIKMASPFPPTPSLPPPHQKTRNYSLTPFSLSLILLLLFVSIFAFSKNALETTLSSSTDYLIWSSSNSTTTNNHQLPPPSPPLTPTIRADPAIDDNGVEPNEQENNPTTPETNTIEATPDPDNKSNEEGGVSIDSKKLNWDTKCDLYNGTWVKDEEYPIYQPSSCPYVDEAYSCQDNGRADSEYTKWRWKPHGCDLPRFNATDFLERLRGKKLMLVGDSMNRNQFESILCLLREGLSNNSRMYEIHGYKITKGRGYFVFKFEDYNCTVEFLRSHFLVKEGIRLNAQQQSNPTLSIDQIDKSANRWKRADILVFNTGHWWTHGKTARGKNYYKEGDFIYPEYNATEAYKRAIRTWGKWIDTNIDPSKKLVFYRGYSNAHFRGGDWDSGGTCNGEKEPILKGAFLNSYPLKMQIVDEVVRTMRVPVILLNVTRLTNFHKDGHPSIYGKTNLEGKQLSAKRQDCSHWCLPGVPDAWNELIYVNLILQQTASSNQKPKWCSSSPTSSLEQGANNWRNWIGRLFSLRLGANSSVPSPRVNPMLHVSLASMVAREETSLMDK